MRRGTERLRHSRVLVQVDPRAGAGQPMRRVQNGAYVRGVGVRLVQTAELRAVPAAGRILVPLRGARHGIRVQPFQGVAMTAREGGHERGEPRAELGVCSEVQGHELRPLVGAEPRDDRERRGPV